MVLLIAVQSVVIFCKIMGIKHMITIFLFATALSINILLVGVDNVTLSMGSCHFSNIYINHDFRLSAVCTLYNVFSESLMVANQTYFSTRLYVVKEIAL